MSIDKGHMDTSSETEAPEPKPQGARALFGSTLIYRVVRAALICLLLVGVGIMCLPFAERFKFALDSVMKADEYQRVIAEVDEAELEAQWILAQEYNRARAYNREHDTNIIIDPFRDDAITMQMNEEYWSLVNPLGNGMMGYLDIPKIGERISIYHGTDEPALTEGVGHIQGTSLPVGGESTHCVLSGHRGLAGAKIFTNLDQMELGDYIVLHILNHDLAYEVDQIEVCLPDEISLIDIVEGEDLLTLVTCTPYAVNTHRLLVRGHAVPFDESMVQMPQVAAMRFLGTGGVWVLVATAACIVALIVVWRRMRAKERR